MKKGQIALVNLFLLTSDKKKHLLKEVVFSLPVTGTRTTLSCENLADRRFLKAIHCTTSATIKKIEVITPLGEIAKKSGSTLVKKSDQSRNNESGAYE